MSAERKTDASWMRVSEAAAAIGRAPATVKSLALRGELENQTVGGVIFIGRASVEKYVAEQQAATAAR